MEWLHSGSPNPKNSECKNLLEKSSPRFFGIKTASSSLCSKGPNSQRGVLLTSAGAIEGHFEGKTPREIHQRGLVLARKCPGSPGTCVPEETGTPGLPTSSVLITHPDLAPSDYLLFLGLKKNLNVSIFVRRGGHCCRRDLVGRTNFWIFLSGLQKLEQRAKRFIERHGDYV